MHRGATCPAAESLYESAGVGEEKRPRRSSRKGASVEERDIVGPHRCHDAGVKSGESGLPGPPGLAARPARSRVHAADSKKTYRARREMDPKNAPATGEKSCDSDAKIR